ncbi:MAG TPA: class I SAM-dependent methyltransferase [Candidatus Dormibacteraeota bacterium]|jgi:SAM-dependent methyltransferase|nr:class I SAM-dependent methyltransferase [Candidatus Dormibacteraeota bacterium]
MTHTYSFDRTVAFYDDTRGLPAPVLDGVVAALAMEIRAAGGGPVLEMGVGTGRIALPLAARGIEVHGVDVATSMLAELLRKGEEQPADAAPVWVCRADATHLPVGDGVYGAAIASLILHLLRDWRTAVHELLRAVRPGGVLLIDPDGRSELNLELSTQLERIVGRSLRAGVRDAAELDAFMAEQGLEARPLGPFSVERRTTLRTWLDRLRANWYSHTWTLDDATRDAACDELARCAESRYGDLDAEVADVHALRWRAFRLVGSPARGDR